MTDLLASEIPASMTPREIVAELDKHIIGQDEAKRAVAIALRNRWRRKQLPSEQSAEINPKNILMIGPTGVGKTEIARRLAKLVHAPFIKVEATKFTEVGYVGRDVDSIIRDLTEIAAKMVRERHYKRVESQAEDAAEERILDALLPLVNSESEQETGNSHAKTRQYMRKKLREGELEDKMIEIDVSANPIGVEIMAPPGMEEMTSQLQSLFQNMNSGKVKESKMTVAQARKKLKDEEAAKLINEDELRAACIRSVEQDGIVFIDEIDKITRASDVRGADVSREGVQRDLLPLIEGSTVATKYGAVKTDHILFITSGAFHHTKPSDLIAELQGRLPIRVELKALGVDDFKRILTEPNFSLTEQYTALLNTENVDLAFTDTGIHRIAEIAWSVNATTENIGARRLHTVLERLLEKISFEAADKSGQKVKVDVAYVNKHLGALVKNEDLSHYIL